MRRELIRRVLPCVGVVAAGVATHAARADELIYGFNDPTQFTKVPPATAAVITGNFTPKPGSSVAQNTSTGVTEGTGSLQINNSANAQYGGALISSVPADLYNAATFSVDVTITDNPVIDGTSSYFDLVPIYFSTDGEIDPDISKSSAFISLAAQLPNTTVKYTVQQQFFDPEENLSADATPGQILTADQAADGSTADAITGLQLTVEHGPGVATTVFVDDLTVPTLTASPEPTSFALVGLGGAALLGRRRRHR